MFGVRSRARVACFLCALRPENPRNLHAAHAILGADLAHFVQSLPPNAARRRARSNINSSEFCAGRTPCAPSVCVFFVHAAARKCAKFAGCARNFWRRARPFCAIFVAERGQTSRAFQNHCLRVWRPFARARCMFFVRAAPLKYGRFARCTRNFRRGARAL